jgi:hypothetical protein
MYLHIDIRIQQSSWFIRSESRVVVILHSADEEDTKPGQQAANHRPSSECPLLGLHCTGTPDQCKRHSRDSPKQKGKTFIIESTVQHWSPRLITVSILSLGPWQLQLYDMISSMYVPSSPRTYHMIDIDLDSPATWSCSWRYLNPPTSRLEAQRVIFLATWFILLTKSPWFLIKYFFSEYYESIACCGVLEVC